MHDNGMTNLQRLILRELAREATEAAQRVRDPQFKLHVLLVAARYAVLAKKADRELAQGDRQSTTTEAH